MICIFFNSLFSNHPKKKQHTIGKETWMFPKNNGTSKSSILIGFSIINHPFWGPAPIFGSTYIISKQVLEVKLWKSSDGSKTGGAEEVEMSLGEFGVGARFVFLISNFLANG